MEMAQYIISIFKYYLPIVFSWGFSHPQPIPNGLRFHVQGYIHKGLVEVVYDETVLLCGSGLSVTLYPPVGLAGENELGVSALFSYNDFDVLTVGDMNGVTESIFTDIFALPDIELLIVGHHGSKYSSSNTFLDALTPETAFISVGKNYYGHPAPETLERLSERGIDIYRTDLNGTVTLRLGERGTR